MCDWTAGWTAEEQALADQLYYAKWRTRKIRKALDVAQVGFNGSDCFIGLLGPKPFFVTPREWGNMLTAGQATWQWLQTCNALYRRALDGDETLGFVRDLVESEAPPELVELNRKIARSGRLRPACFVRLDMPIIGKAVEAQIPGSGWGYRLALTHAFSGYPHSDAISEFASAVRALTGKDNPRVIHVRRTPELGSDDRYFAEAVRKAGIQYRMTLREVPPPQSTDLILRHYFSDFLGFPGAESALAAYLAGDLEIEPPPSLLTDQKVGMVLPFDPRTAQYFSEDARALFPETRLIQPEDILRVMALPGSQRDYVIKYAGLKPEMRAQGKQVYNLAQCSKTRVLGLEEQINTSRPRQPWILQRLIQKRYKVCGENEARERLETSRLYARFTPIFALAESAARMMFCTANFRNFWKVSSHADSILLPVTQGSSARQEAEPWE